MTQHRDEFVSKVARPDGYDLLRHNTGARNEWLRGTVRTQWGYVRVHAEPKFVSISVIHDGYDVNRTYRQAFTRRGLVTLANRFAEEVCG